ncbi:hypothetical protein GM708_09525 [Vibrio cholerae]|nr:hypothetical protein [Vibrio cholerae]
MAAPIPAHYLPLVRTAVLLALVTVLLVTVLPSLSVLHLLLNVMILVSILRRVRKRGPRRDGAAR